MLGCMSELGISELYHWYRLHHFSYLFSQNRLPLTLVQAPTKSLMSLAKFWSVISKRNVTSRKPSQDSDKCLTVLQ